MYKTHTGTFNWGGFSAISARIPLLIFYWVLLRFREVFLSSTQNLKARPVQKMIATHQCLAWMIKNKTPMAIPVIGGTTRARKFVFYSQTQSGLCFRYSLVWAVKINDRNNVIQIIRIQIYAVITVLLIPGHCDNF